MREDVHGFGDLVVSPHGLSTQAGMDILAAGGSAVDAAIAANAVQGVVAPETCGIGGDLFALVWTDDMEAPVALDSSGTAGSNVDPAELRAEGHDTFPPRHPASVTIPGCVSGWEELHGRFGRLPLGDLLEPAIRLATRGFPASTEFSRATRALETTLRSVGVGAQILPAEGTAERGDRVVRPNLASTLGGIARHGREAFYEGQVAEAISRAVDDRITVADLAGYRSEWIEPARLDVFGVTGWTIPPSSQGYLTLATLGVFERLVGDTPPHDPTWTHLLIESFRSMAWERNDVVADRRYAPHSWRRLLDADRLSSRADVIDPDRAGAWPQAGQIPGGTAYLCAIDAAGMGVSLIQSNFYGLGTGIGAGDTGLILHNRGAGFDLRPGHPNELAPGKRPLHTLSPTLWTREGRLAAILGTRGGHQQPQVLAQMAASVFALDRSPATAHSTPRWAMDSYGPGARSVVQVESTMPPHVVEGLERRGHTVSVQRSQVGGWGPVSMITIAEDGLRTGAADPRVDTSAAAAR